MLIKVLYAATAIGFFMPNWLIGALLPALLAGQRLAMTDDDRMSLGPISVYPLDLVLGLMIVRWLLSGGPARVRADDGGVQRAIAAWAILNLLTTVLAGMRFGEPHLMRCMVLWGRGMADAALVFVMADALRTRQQIRWTIQLQIGFLAALVAIQFVNYVGVSRGFVIGEVQGIERGQTRIFGPVGDSVGFVLLLGYLIGLCRSRPFEYVAFAAAILLTAGIGALFTVFVATVLFAVVRLPRDATAKPRRSQLPMYLGLGTAALIALIFADSLTTTLRDRLSGTSRESGDQRLATGRLAVAIIEDNLATGVGFMGFRQVLDRYGGSRYFDLTTTDGATANANNQPLQSLCDAGLPGLLALIVLVVLSARLLYRAAVRARTPLERVFFHAVMLWLLAQLFGNLAATWLTPASFVAVILWIDLGIALKVCALEADRSMAVQRPEIDGDIAAAEQNRAGTAPTPSAPRWTLELP